MFTDRFRGSLPQRSVSSRVGEEEMGWGISPLTVKRRFFKVLFFPSVLGKIQQKLYAQDLRNGIIHCAHNFSQFPSEACTPKRFVALALPKSSFMSTTLSKSEFSSI